MRDTEIRKKIGHEIRNIRVKLGLTQNQFADLFNESDPLELQTKQSDISKYELAQTVIPGDKLEKFRMLIQGGDIGEIKGNIHENPELLEGGD